MVKPPELCSPQCLSQPDGSMPTEQASLLPSFQLPRSLPLATAPLRPFCAGIQLPDAAGSEPVPGDLGFL